MSRHKQEMHKMQNKHKMFTITSYHRNANQNKKDIPFTTYQVVKDYFKNYNTEYWQECKEMVTHILLTEE